MGKLLIICVLILGVAGVASIISMQISDQRIKKLVLREIRRAKDFEELHRLHDSDCAANEEEQ